MIDAGDVSRAAICFIFEQIWCSTRSKSFLLEPVAGDFCRVAFDLSPSQTARAMRAAASFNR
jgi:hypothetical protein